MKIILDHNNLETIWVSVCISEHILCLYNACLSLVNKIEILILLVMLFRSKSTHTKITYL